MADENGLAEPWRVLTARERDIYDLSRVSSDKEIATELGVSVQFVKNTLMRCRKKLGEGPDPLRMGRSQRMENSNPEVAAMGIEVAADPLVSARVKTQKAAIEEANAILEASGMPGKLSAAVMRRMMVKHADLVTLKKKINTNEILDRLDDNIFLIDSYIDDKVAAEANLRDLAMSKAILIDKRQLLRGEPTQIISDHERKKMHELLPELVAEARRRGITIEGKAEVVEEKPDA